MRRAKRLCSTLLLMVLLLSTATCGGMVALAAQTGTIKADAGSVSVYTSNSDTSEKLNGFLAAGQRVDIHQNLGDWLLIDYNGQVGYIQSGYVTIEQPAPEPIVVVVDDDPKDNNAADNPQVDQLARALIADVPDGGNAADVKQDAPKDDGAADAENQVAAARYRPNVYARINLAVSSSTLSLFETASADSRVLGEYPHNSYVRVLQTGLTWTQVETGDGNVGYMQSGSLDFSGSLPGNPLPPTNNQNYVYATVNNPGYNERLNLRAQPSLNAAILGRYYNGVQVKVYERGAVWSRVEVYGIHGYMMTAYLLFQNTPYPTPTASPGNILHAWVSNQRPNERLNLRAQPSLNSAVLGQYYNGTSVLVYEYGPIWCGVSVNGIRGYMMTQYLTFSGSPVPTQTPGPLPTYPPGPGTTAWVNNPVSTSRLNLREYPSTSSRSLGMYYNGTQVSVLEHGSTWCYVQVRGIYGYMMTRYLSFSGYNPTPSMAVVKNPGANQRLNLRALPSRSSTSLGQYYNGTVVRILEYGGTWCRVEVNGIRGYMMTQYLRIM